MREKTSKDIAAESRQRVPPRLRKEALRTAARRHALVVHAASSRAHQEPIGKPRVFVSYAHTDNRRVARFVAWLMAEGFCVIWDREFHAGGDFHDAIRSHIDGAHAVIVIWSSASAASRFVRDEASRAMKLGKLVCVYAPGFDLDDLPMGLGHLHAVSMKDKAAIRRSLARYIGQSSLGEV